MQTKTMVLKLLVLSWIKENLLSQLYIESNIEKIYLRAQQRRTIVTDKTMTIRIRDPVYQAWATCLKLTSVISNSCLTRKPPAITVIRTLSMNSPQLKPLSEICLTLKPKRRTSSYPVPYPVETHSLRMKSSARLNSSSPLTTLATILNSLRPQSSVINKNI